MILEDFDSFFGGLLIIITGFVFVICFFEDFRLKKSSYIVSIVLLSMALSYLVVPLSIHFFSIGKLPYSGYKEQYFFICAGLVFVFFSAFFIGNKLALLRNAGLYFEASGTTNERAVAIFLLFLSIVFFLLFVSFYGGFSYVIENISRIRSGTDENKSYVGAFFRIFTYYMYFVLFYFFSELLLKKCSFYIFLLVFLLAIFKSFLDGGRGGLLLNIVGMFFVYIFVRRKFPLTFFIVSLGLVFFVVLFGKTVLFQLFSGGELEFELGSIFNDFIINYSHQYMAMNVAIANDAIGERFFSDFVNWIFKPLKLFGFYVPDSVSYYNTFQVKGVWDSEVPPGIVLFAVYQGGLFFVPVMGFFSGYAVRWLDRFIVNSVFMREGSSSLIISASVILIIYFPFLYDNSDPALFVQWFLQYIVMFFLFFVFRKFKIKRMGRTVGG